MQEDNLQRELLVSYFLNSYGENEGFCILESASVRNLKRTLVFLEPVCKIWADSHGSYAQSESKITQKFSGVWEALELVANWQKEIKESSKDKSIPHIAGYFSYEMLHLIEKVEKTKTNAKQVPLYLFYVYRTVAEISGLDLTLHIAKFAAAYNAFWPVFDERTDVIVDSAQEFSTAKLNLSVAEVETELQSKSNFTKQKYCDAVEEIRELIRDGEVYQVNLSQRFVLPYEKSAKLFYQELRRVSPADYSAYLCAESEDGSFTIAGSSPELFFKLQGKNLLCSPIKGTRSRSLEQKADAALKEELAKSEKDLAELSMIVDLVRNDMSKIAEIGSVRVERHARVESLPQVHHLLSDVYCKIKPEITLIEIVKALFPCGSISGAPKIAAMNIISKLEKAPRGIYTGSFGWMAPDGSMQFNVAIRTALLRDSTLCFQAGGGIVFASDAVSEYQETIAKAQGIYTAWRLASNDSSENLAPII